MSQNLYWRPIESGRVVGGITIRDIIVTHFGHSCVLNYYDLDFLRGLVAGNVEGASDLIELINQHEQIELYVG